MNEIEIETAETRETLENREEDWQELSAKLNEYNEKAIECDEGKKRRSLITFREEKIKHLKEVYNARVSNLSLHVIAQMNSERLLGLSLRSFESRVKL